MKTILTFTCIYCDKEYDKEMDVEPGLFVSKLAGPTMFVGVCPGCMEKDNAEPGKAMESFLKRHEDEIDT